MVLPSSHSPSIDNAAGNEGGPVRTTGWCDSNEAECTAGKCVPEGANASFAEGWRGSNIGKKTKRLIS